MGEYLDKTKKKAAQAVEDLANLKGQGSDESWAKLKHEISRKSGRTRVQTRGPGRAAKDVKHVFKAGSR